MMAMSLLVTICCILQVLWINSLILSNKKIKLKMIVRRMANKQEGLGYFRLAGDEKEVALESQLIDQSTVDEKIYVNLLYAYDNLRPDEIRELTNIILRSNDINVVRTRKVIIDLIRNADIIQEKIMSNTQGYSEEYLIDDLRVIRSQLRLNTRNLLPNNDDENYIDMLNRIFTKKGK